MKVIPSDNWGVEFLNSLEDQKTAKLGEPTGTSDSACSCGKPLDDTMVKKRVMQILKKLSKPTTASGFVVRVLKMKESHRVTYWVTLDRGDRPKDARPWDNGIITPFMHENKEYADEEAEKWAIFLGVVVST